MKNTIIAAVVVLMVIGLVSCSYAGERTVVGGEKVDITVKAEVPSLLRVHLSDTTIDFGKITSLTNQQKKIDIQISSCAQGGNIPKMTVTDAAALKWSGDVAAAPIPYPATIDTHYAVQVGGETIPWQTPAQFNSVHTLTKDPNIPVALWAQIKPTNLQATGVYQNTFTVVFSQNT